MVTKRQLTAFGLKGIANRPDAMNDPMAYEDYDDEPVSTMEALDTATQAVSDLDERVRRLLEATEKSNALLRADIAQSRKEVAEARATMLRMQARMDNQLVALVLANIASGAGVAALVLGATRAVGA